MASSATSSDSTSPRIPVHVALICDGNGRWARARNLPLSAGHAAGADRVLNLIRHLSEDGVSYVTLFAFSAENWKRSATELRGLWKVLESSADAMLKSPPKGVRIKIIGDLDDPRIPEQTRVALRKLERVTETNGSGAEAGSGCSQKLTVSLAINYGGRQDMLSAMKSLVRDGVDVDDISVDAISDRLSTSDMPDPDLVIRTSGECRLSNFLLWNIAYSELYFCECTWPDFSQEEWNKALKWYQGRQRRFGGRNDEGG